MKFIVTLNLSDIVGLIIVGSIIILFIVGCAAHSIHELFFNKFFNKKSKKKE